MKRIWLSSPHMGEKEWGHLQQAYASNWIAPLGPAVDNFEKDIANYLGVKAVAALNSGTAALHLALKLLGVSVGDFVICQSFTFVASANPVSYLGAIPVFVDSEPHSLNMDPKCLEDAIKWCIKEGKTPKAIVPVHVYGMPADMDSIMKIAHHFNIPVVEDAAEAMGSTYMGKACGSIGDLAILSFNGNKIITTSGGGALVGNDEVLIEKARYLASQARLPANHYEHTEIGYNYRLSNLCASIGRGQMEVLGERVIQRRHNFYYYKEKLEEILGIRFLAEPEGSFSNRWLSTIFIDPDKSSGVTNELIRQALENAQIESRPLWKPMHMQVLYKNAPAFTNGVSEKLFEQGLCLPSGSNLKHQDLDEVISIIRNLFAQARHQNRPNGNPTGKLIGISAGRQIKDVTQAK